MSNAPYGWLAPPYIRNIPVIGSKGVDAGDPGNTGLDFQAYADGRGIIPKKYGVLKLATPTNPSVALAGPGFAFLVRALDSGSINTMLSVMWTWWPITNDFDLGTLDYTLAAPYIGGAGGWGDSFVITGTGVPYPPGGVYMDFGISVYARSPGEWGFSRGGIYVPDGYTTWGFILELTLGTFGPVPATLFDANTGAIGWIAGFTVAGWQ